MLVDEERGEKKPLSLDHGSAKESALLAHQLATTLVPFALLLRQEISDCLLRAECASFVFVNWPLQEGDALGWSVGRSFGGGTA